MVDIEAYVAWKSGPSRPRPAPGIERLQPARTGPYRTALRTMTHSFERNVDQNVERRGFGLVLGVTEFHGHVSYPVIANHPIPRFAAQINNDLALSLPVENLLRFQISPNLRARHSDSKSALKPSHLRLIADVQFRPDPRGSRLPLFDFLIGISSKEQSPRHQDGKNKQDDFGGASHAASCHASSEFAMNGLVVEIFRPQCPP